MSDNQEQRHFDQLAERWDEVRATDSDKLRLLVEMTGLTAGDSVLDVGCGTGVLAPYLRQAVGEQGRITAIDFSANMISRGAGKHAVSAGIRFVAGDIMEFQSAEKFDKIICLNFFPHMADKPAFIRKMAQLLQMEGCLVIMHDISRETVNGIHKESAVVTNDRLPKGEKTAEMLTAAGYHVTDVIDNQQLYFVRAAWRPGGI